MSGPLWLPPAYGELADDQDELGWDIDLHGRMVDEAAEDDAVVTALWTPDDDAAFRSYALGVDPLVLGGRKLDLPAILRSFGLVVEVVPGWETRGSATFNPGGVVGHHTAGPATGDRPSLRICTHGRSDLPGPLCQVFLTRAGVAIVVAAGRANHAGRGGFRGLVGNSAVFGIEAESKGTLPNAWTPQQLEAYPKVVAALLKACNRDESWYCRHATWAPSRKIDTVELSDQWMRDRSGLILRGGNQPKPPPPAPTPQTEIDVDKLPTLSYALKSKGPHVKLVQAALVHVHNHDLRQEGGIDGDFGPGLHREIVAYQKARGLGSDGIVGPATWRSILKTT